MNNKYIRIFFCIFSILYSSLFALEKSIEEIEKDAYQKLEKGLEQAGLGLVETGIGVHRFSYGDPISGAVAVGAGVKNFKDSIESFTEAKKLFEQVREYDSIQSENRSDDSRDFDSWDRDY